MTIIPIPKAGGDKPELSCGCDASAPLNRCTEATGGSACILIHKHRQEGKWGKSRTSNPKELSLSSHPLSRGKQKQERLFKRRGNPPLHHIGSPSPLLQTMPLPVPAIHPPAPTEPAADTLAPAPGISPRFEGGQDPEEPPSASANLGGSRAAMVYHFFSPAVLAASSTIGQSPTAAPRPPSAAPPSAISCHFSSGMTEMKRQRRRGFFFFFFEGGGGNQTNLTGMQDSPASPPCSCCSQGWMESGRLQRRSRDGVLGGDNQVCLHPKLGSAPGRQWLQGPAATVGFGRGERKKKTVINKKIK